jgi:hypothetical protein
MPSPLSIVLHEALRQRTEIDTHLAANRTAPLSLLLTYRNSLASLQAAIGSALPALDQIIQSRMVDDPTRPYQDDPTRPYQGRPR